MRVIAMYLSRDIEASSYLSGYSCEVLSSWKTECLFTCLLEQYSKLRLPLIDLYFSLWFVKTSARHLVQFISVAANHELNESCTIDLSNWMHIKE